MAPTRRRRAAAASRRRPTHGRLVGEDVGVVPLGAGDDRDVRPVGVEVAGVLVGLDDERPRRSPRAPSPAAPPVTRRRQQRPDERRWIQAGRDAGRARASPPSCSCRASRRRRRGVRPTAASATTCCHGSIGIPAARAARELGVVRVDRGQGLRDGQAVRRAARVVTCAASWAHASGMPAAPRAPACTATARPRRSPTRSRRPAARAGPRRCAPAPAAPDDVHAARRRRSAAPSAHGGQARADASASRVTRIHRQPLDARASARRRRWPACCPSGRRPRRGGGRRRRRRRRWRRRSARPAWPPSRRRARRRR